MPIYEFRCSACGAIEDRTMTISQMEESRDMQRCSRCEGHMSKLISVPSLLGTDTRFFQGNNDGLGDDQYSRTMIRRNAAKMGMSIAGKKYFPQLCRKGHTMDPFACAGTQAEIKEKLAILGRGAEGGINVPCPQQEHEPKPYRVADDIVEKEARLIARQNKMKKVGPKEKAALMEQVRKRITPKFQVPV